MGLRAARKMQREWVAVLLLWLLPLLLSRQVQVQQLPRPDAGGSRRPHAALVGKAGTAGTPERGTGPW